MSEPVTLYDAEGHTLTVYTRQQVDKLLAGGQWFAAPPDTTAAGPEAGADVEEVAQPAPDVEEAAPSPPSQAKRTATKRKGGL